MLAVTLSLVASVISTPIRPGNSGCIIFWISAMAGIASLLLSCSARRSRPRDLERFDRWSCRGILRRSWPVLSTPAPPAGRLPRPVWLDPAVRQSIAQGRREALRLAGAGDQHDHDLGAEQLAAAPADALVEGQRRGRRRLDAGRHLEDVVDPRGP